MIKNSAAKLATNSTFVLVVKAVVTSHLSAEGEIEKVGIILTNLLNPYKDIKKVRVRASNRYYMEYSSVYLVENLAWTTDRIIHTCEDPLRNKILDGVVEVSAL